MGRTGKKVPKASAAGRPAKAEAPPRRSRTEAQVSPSPSPPPASPGEGDETRSRAQSPRRPFLGYDVERAAYLLRRPDLLRDVPGRFVVFVGEEMIGPFDTLPDAVEAAYRRFGFGPIYAKQVLAEEPTFEVGTTA